MESEIGDNSNDDNDMEVARVLEKALIDTNLDFGHSSSTDSSQIIWTINEVSSHADELSDTVHPTPTVIDKQIAFLPEYTEKSSVSLYTLAGQGDLYTIKYMFLHNQLDSSFHKEFKSGLPLIPAARFNWVQVVTFMLENDCPVSAVGEFGTTALHQSCCMGNIEVVKILLKYKAEMNVQCFDGSTPLHYAVYSGNVDCVNVLLNSGVDVTIENVYKLTAIDLAFKMKNKLVESAIQTHLLKLFKDG